MLKSLSEQKTIRIDSDLVDDEAVIENLFLETMLFVDYMYAHFDNFKLIFACSKGSQVENFIEDITERYTAKNMKLILFNAKQEQIITEIKEFEVHVITKGYITSLCECILHDIRMIMLANILEALLFFNIMVGKA